MRPLHNQHAIPIRIKPVLLLNRVPVSRQRQILAGEGAHQQQQACARQMEIGEHGAHGAELETGVNEYVCFAVAGFNARALWQVGDLHHHRG